MEQPNGNQVGKIVATSKYGQDCYDMMLTFKKILEKIY